MTWVVATFYKFVRLPDFAEQRAPLLALCQAQGVKGTILLAPEGINATLAGSRAGIDAVIAQLRLDPRFADIKPKESSASFPPFERMKVRLKKEIVTLGMPEIDPSQQTGTYVPPQAWNELICDPEVTLIDTRNVYEVRIGTFQGAQDPRTRSFREFPNYVRDRLDPKQHKKVALFCTGGIRCEKATGLLLREGFQQVYHLQGGILKYLEQVPSEASLWQGECFVFDERVAVKDGLEPGTHILCQSCGHPVSPQAQASPKYEAGICCPHCFDQLTPEKKARQQARQQHMSYRRSRRTLSLTDVTAKINQRSTEDGFLKSTHP